MLLSLLIPGQMIGLFTDNETTVEIGVKALTIICIGFIISAVSVTCCGALEALQKGMASLLISLSRYAVVMIPVPRCQWSLLGIPGHRDHLRGCCICDLPPNKIVTGVPRVYRPHTQAAT